MMRGMADAFKELINTQTVRDTGTHLQRVWPAFERARFEALASAGLAGLEMKARAMQLADALQATLPMHSAAEFEHACSVMEASLAPARDPDDDQLPPRQSQDGLAGWVVWSLGEVVARVATQDADRLPRALQALHALTQRFTAEFAIRPLLHHHADHLWPTLLRWTRDPSAHVRRLASEGSRPRLPWGLRLSALVADPRPTLPLLAALQDDPSAYVRRSVANHLNDIAKDHPQLVVDWLHTHLPGAPPARRALLKHACRSLIKQGHPQVLAAWGHGAPLQGRATLRLSAETVRVGESLTLTVTLNSHSDSAQPLLIDYVVHHVKANGSLTPKVFKAWTLTLPPGAERTLNKTHSLRPISTRRYHPGTHHIGLQVNGHLLAEAAFELRVDGG